MNFVFNKTCRYSIINETAGTVNSAVYKAQDNELRRTVCIKAVPITCPEDVKRAEGEVRTMLAASEKTSRVPAIFDKYYDEPNSAYYIIMQWINGETLRAKFEKGLLSDDDFLDYIIQLCSILSILEKDNESHKDIKPENIMITNEGDVYLIDFGLVISVPNGIEGTEDYKAPEMGQRSFSSDRRWSDIFSVGVIMYEHFAKKVPVRGMEYGISGRGGTAKEWSVFNDPCDCPAVNSVIKKCMAYDRKARYKAAYELRGAVRKAKSELRKYKNSEEQNGSQRNGKMGKL